MPFVNPDTPQTPFALPEGFSLDVEALAPDKSLWAASFRQENIIGSLLAQRSSGTEDVFGPETFKPFDPNYRPFEDIEGTTYAQFSDRFVGVRTRGDLDAMKAQIDLELEDGAVIEAAGGYGILTSMGAALLSPTNLLPGGAVVKTGRGVSIMASVGSVATAAGSAAAIDEMILHGSQQTRTGAESAVAIGGSVILGGLLGAAAGKLTSAEMQRMGHNIDVYMQVTRDAGDEALSEAARVAANDLAAHDLAGEGGSVGAASVRLEDLSLRREWMFRLMRKVPGVSLLTRSDPVLRAQLSELQEVRRTVAELVETPLQYAVNDQGVSVATGSGPVAQAGSVEQIVKARINDELASAIGEFSGAYAQYWNDGPVGLVGRVTAPITARYQHLMGRTEKLTRSEFDEEVGRALFSGDLHPIPQVQQLAQNIRAKVLDPIAKEAEEIGLFQIGERPEHFKSYFHRVYDTEKITRHFGDGSVDDLRPVLQRAFVERRTLARERLARAKEAEEMAAKVEGRLEDLEDAQRAFVEANQLSAKAKAREEGYVLRENIEVEEAVDGAVRSIIGLKEGQHSIGASLSSPTIARALDVPDDLLLPWLQRDATTVLDRYFRALVPDIELTKKFGSVDMTTRLDAIKREITAQLKTARSETAQPDTVRSRIARVFRKSPRKAIQEEGDIRLREVEAMRDRIRGLYGVPDNPQDIWVRGGRFMRTLSYSGLLGGVTLSALPDIAGVVGRNGYEAMLGVTAPRRMIQAARQSADISAASEWLLNARAMRLNELMNPYSKVGGFERGVAEIGRGFGWANGMIPWNTAWKSLAGALSMSGAAKAAKAVQAGTATKAQIRRLAENGIEPFMAGRIAAQLDAFGDMDGRIWFSNARDWTDQDAFLAFRGLMTREMDISIITPGQDKPLFWSREAGKFLFQFKSFAVSANHRILLSGLQRADANVAAQAMIAITLGGVVSNLKADIGNWSRKEGAAFYADALDRSGLAGWIFEANALSEAATSGRLGISALTGERLSRFQSRSQLLGLAGPNVDLGMNIMSATAAASRGELKQSDVGRVISAVPGQNLPYLLWFSERVEQGVGERLGAE